MHVFASVFFFQKEDHIRSESACFFLFFLKKCACDNESENESETEVCEKSARVCMNE